jgi:serine/threonine-protein kinase SRPK3
MASSFLRRAWKSIHRLAWKPFAFPNEGIATISTDIKEANILLPADQSVLTEFEKEELDELSPKKEFNGSIIHLSRAMGMPRAFGAPVLCDFGSAVPLDDGLEHREDIQPNVYRAPEIVLDIPWTYSVDIWNVGCMVSGHRVKLQ